MEPEPQESNASSSSASGQPTSPPRTSAAVVQERERKRAGSVSLVAAESPTKISRRSEPEPKVTVVANTEAVAALLASPGGESRGRTRTRTSSRDGPSWSVSYHGPDSGEANEGNTFNGAAPAAVHKPPLATTGTSIGKPYPLHLARTFFSRSTKPRSISAHSRFSDVESSAGHLTPLASLITDATDYFGFEKQEPLAATAEEQEEAKAVLADLGLLGEPEPEKEPVRSPAHLPTEILQRIFSFLLPDPQWSSAYDAPPSTHDLYQCTRVCREWYYAGVQMLWRYPRWTNLGQFDRWVRFCKTLKAPVPPPAEEESDSKRKGKGKSKGKLKPVEPIVVRASSQLHASQSLSVIGKLGAHLLRRLEVSHTPFLMNFFTAEHLSTLTGLFEGITHLDLSGCASLTDDVLASFISSNPRYLVSIDLSNCMRITDASVQVISVFLGPWKRLRRLLLRNCGHLSDTSLAVIAVNLLPTLRMIDISGCRRLSDHGVLQFARKSGASQPGSGPGSALTKFGMSGCWRLTRNGYMQVLDVLFSESSRIASFESSLPLHPLASADQVFSNLPVGLFSTLTSLTLKDAEKCVNDAVFGAIAKACGGSLRGFHLHGAVLVTENGFLRHIEDFAALEKLSMPSARRLGDQSLLAIVHSPNLSKRLTELDISGWVVTDVGLMQAFESTICVDPLPNLEALVMVDCHDSFSFHGVFAIVRGLLGNKPPSERRLKLLDVSGCPDLDNADGHVRFIDALPANVNNNNNVQNPALPAIGNPLMNQQQQQAPPAPQIAVGNNAALQALVQQIQTMAAGVQATLNDVGPGGLLEVAQQHLAAQQQAMAQPEIVESDDAEDEEEEDSEYGEEDDATGMEVDTQQSDLEDEQDEDEDEEEEDDDDGMEPDEGTLIADPSPVSDDFVLSILQLPERPLGSSKLGGLHRWYCLLKGASLEKVVEEAMRRKLPRGVARNDDVDEAVGVPHIANAAAG